MPLLTTRASSSASALGFGAASGAPAAMTAIASTKLTASSTQVGFLSIPTTYTDLFVVCNFEGTSPYGANANVRLNGSASAALYSQTYLYGDRSTVAVTRFSTGVASYFELATTNVMATDNTLSLVMHIADYANTSYKKTVLARAAVDKTSSGHTSLIAGTFHSNSAITRIDIGLGGLESFVPGSTFALYGIKKAV